MRVEISLGELVKESFSYIVRCLGLMKPQEANYRQARRRLHALSVGDGIGREPLCVKATALNKTAAMPPGNHITPALT
jgi:hypothetical protein